MLYKMRFCIVFYKTRDDKLKRFENTSWKNFTEKKTSRTDLDGAEISYGSPNLLIKNAYTQELYLK